MRFRLFLAVVSVAIGAEHPDLNGVWKTADAGETISIHQKDDAVEIAEQGKETSDIQCNTMGQACKVKGGEVTMWFNNGTLVVMESLHGNSKVIKKRLKVADDGKSLEEEIVHIVPAGSTEKVSLVRESRS